MELERRYKGGNEAEQGLELSVDISDAWQGRSRIMYKRQAHVDRVPIEHPSSNTEEYDAISQKK